ncbi:adenylate kinase family protein [Dactylosporangium sp. CA-139066]|uniref:adenylate kinase family protein n=1 Tax=Dactylosporangium sp. CA-139066 TaxID=3239930 RepID=UPI003D930124
MRVLLIGAPGAGKGTQGARIAAHFHIPHIAAGDILRGHVARRTAIGRAARRHLDRGALVPDDVLFDALGHALTGAAGYVLDGLPRTVEQAHRLERLGAEHGLEPDVALHLRADDEELTRRLLARGATGGRSDDTAPVIRERLGLYHRTTAPLRAWYSLRGRLLSVDAMRPADLVGRDVLAALEARFAA